MLFEKTIPEIKFYFEEDNFCDLYYDEIKLINLDEFLGMWQDGDFYKTKVKKDFIDIK